ncbi:hypothetical protein Rcae01_01156 [Novipirellula caenicola]|uniref:Uncharacterized protein n=1 Tax=Novipirellula caenicola TaxID=1536901 RepID=A0ABP9VKJ0_9BACT
MQPQWSRMEDGTGKLSSVLSQDAGDRDSKQACEPPVTATSKR